MLQASAWVGRFMAAATMQGAIVVGLAVSPVFGQIKPEASIAIASDDASCVK